MINWSFTICFVAMVFYLCFCIYQFISIADYFHNKVYSFKYRVSLFTVILCFMCFGVSFLFSLIEKFLL